VPSKQTEELIIKETVEALEQIRVVDHIPYNCTVLTILRHWPAGCNALVDVAVGFGSRQVLPREGFVALDGTTVTTVLNVDAEKNEEFWANVRNTDSVNDHTVSVIALIREK
jgi:hypothetical protein